MRFDRTNISEKFDEYMHQRMNKKKYNNILKLNRIGRKRNKRLKELKKRIKVTEKKIESEGGKLGFDSQKDGPFDADFWFKMETGLDSPRMKLPEPKDKLFVLKAIDKYEPLINREPDSMTVDDKVLLKPHHRTP
jgi:hypothetical protein